MIVLVSGGFDPPHVGHLRLLKAAAQHGRVVVALNSDSWLMRKKGFVFMPWAQREELLDPYPFVSLVMAVNDADGTVVDAIERIRPHYFANGGDRTHANDPERRACERIGCKQLWNMGGGKVQSSSEMLARQWGEHRILCEHPGFRVKLLKLWPGKSTSLQRHEHRTEHWVFPETDRYQVVPAGEKHQITNAGDKPLHVVEVWTGAILSDDDIERFDDPHANAVSG